MDNDVKLARWLNDEMDAQELKEFESLPEYATYQKIKKYSAGLEPPEADMEALYKKISENKYRAVSKPKVKVRRLNQWLPRVAAVIVITLGLAFYLYTSRLSNHSATIAATTAFLLPDASQVTLNAASDASYKQFNWSNNRRLELEGEAYFVAAKGTSFDVITSLGTVTVVGTRFNVKNRDGRFDVVCYEGKVKVATPTETLFLTPGKAVAFEAGRKIELPDVKASEPGWVNRHEIDFSRETSKGVFAELERQYNVTFVVNAQIDEKGGYNGALPTNDLKTALDKLLPMYKLTYKRQGDKIILLSE